MDLREITNRIEQTFGKAVSGAAEAGAFPHIVVQSDSIKPVLSYCVHDTVLRFDFLDCITAMDTGQDIIVIYQMFSTGFSHRLNVKAAVNRHDARLPSATGFWRAASAYELEIAEMFGVVFEGHPAPRSLLLPEDWQGHPLRKDYVFPEEYHGVEHRRDPLRKEHARP